MTTQLLDTFDVFLCHAHVDAKIVEVLGGKLDEAGLRVWLDKWVLVPGEHWQQGMARGLDQAETCAVCVGKDTPKGWFREEIERALNRRTKDESFRVIPVILPNGDSKLIDDFLELGTWVDFKNGIDDTEALYVLVCGVTGKAPGRGPHIDTGKDPELAPLRAKLKSIRALRQERLIDDDIALEYQRRVIDEIMSR